jgi:hypothetical protein
MDPYWWCTTKLFFMLEQNKTVCRAVVKLVCWKNLHFYLIYIWHWSQSHASLYNILTALFSVVHIVLLKNLGRYCSWIIMLPSGMVGFIFPLGFTDRDLKHEDFIATIFYWPLWRNCSFRHPSPLAVASQVRKRNCLVQCSTWTPILQWNKVMPSITLLFVYNGYN